MTMIVHKDLAGKGGVSRSLNGGWNATRVFMVEKAPGGSDAIVYNALQNSQVPKDGDRHPTIPGIIVDNVQGKSLSSRQVEITISYKPLAGGSTSPDEEGQTQISISSSVQTVRSNRHFITVGNKDVEKLIVLKYRYPKGKDPNIGPNKAGENPVREVVPTIERQVPVIVVRFSRTESSDPAQRGRDFVGKLNSRVFMGSKKGSWLCTDIGGNSGDSGLTYKNYFEFMYAIPGTDTDGKLLPGWFTTVSFSDEKTGKIPSDVETFKLNGVKTAIQHLRSQEFTNFSLLKLGPLSRGARASHGR